MNRLTPIDSENALDAITGRADNAAMAIKTNFCLLDRIVRERNMARFYELSVEPTLFGEIALMRRWGRIGTWGRQLTVIHPDEGAALSALEDMARRKERRGYSARL